MSNIKITGGRKHRHPYEDGSWGLAVLPTSHHFALPTYLPCEWELDLCFQKHTLLQNVVMGLNVIESYIKVV